MDPIISETDETEEKEDEEQEYKISFSKQNHMFCCDTRRMLSWFGKEDPKRYLYIDFENRKEIFALIVTKCFAIGGVEIEPNYKNSKLEFKTNIAGFSQCFADVYLEGKLIGEKKPITSKGIKINAPINSGNYKIVDTTGSDKTYQEIYEQLTGASAEGLSVDVLANEISKIMVSEELSNSA
jgi:hypothetical protein